jgi:hypothetical protein
VKKFFNNLFSRETEAEEPPSELTTAPLSEEQLAPVSVKVDKLDPPQMVVGCARSVGRQRDHNEDSLFTFNATIASNSHSMPFGIYIIADGMGGTNTEKSPARQQFA